MHWSFFIYVLVALTGWCCGAVVRWSTRPPAWLIG